MGFMGLENWVCSDNSSDFMGDILDIIGKKFLEHVEKKDNCYNTPGWIDVTLISEELFLKNKHVWPHLTDDIRSALSTCKKYTSDMLDDLKPLEDNLYKDFKRMHKNLSLMLQEKSNKDE